MTRTSKQKPAQKANLKEVNSLLDICLAECYLKNDSALSRMLEVSPSAISKLRNGTQFPSASFLVSIHENIGISFDRMRKILNVGFDYKF